MPNIQNQTLPLVYYIMGTARSGSTILEILLSNNDETFGAGELTGLANDGLVENGECSCQAAVTECAIWGEVKKQLDLSKVQSRSWAKLQSSIDRHTGFFRHLFHLVSHTDLHSYGDLNLRLLSILKQCTGCSRLVDSSKYAGRALVLRKLLEEDSLFVICLTRSPEGLMKAFQKQNKDEQKSKSPFQVLFYYLGTLLSMRIACWKLGDSVIKIRYEDLMNDPNSALLKISAHGGIDLTGTVAKVSNNEPFNVGHIVTGNRLRKNKSVIFRETEDKKFHYSISQRSLITLMNLWRWSLRF